MFWSSEDRVRARFYYAESRQNKPQVNLWRKSFWRCCASARNIREIDIMELRNYIQAKAGWKPNGFPSPGQRPEDIEQHTQPRPVRTKVTIIGLFSLSHEQNKARFNYAMARKQRRSQFRRNLNGCFGGCWRKKSLEEIFLKMLRERKKF